MHALQWAPAALLSSLASALGGLLQELALLLCALLQLSRHARLLRLKGCALCRGRRLRLLPLSLCGRLHEMPKRADFVGYKCHKLAWDCQFGPHPTMSQAREC